MAGIFYRAPDKGRFCLSDAKKMGENACSLKAMRTKKRAN